MRMIRTALAAVAVGAFALLSAGPASAGEHDNGHGHGGHQCDDGPDYSVTKGGGPGHGGGHPPCQTTTSSTVPETTTSTVAPTTSTTVAPTTSSTVIAVPTTVVASPSTTVGQQPTSTVAPASPTTQPLVRPLPAARPVSSGQLPHTGTNTGPMVATGAGLIAVGGALAYAARRRLAG